MKNEAETAQPAGVTAGEGLSQLSGPVTGGVRGTRAQPVQGYCHQMALWQLLQSKGAAAQISASETTAPAPPRGLGASCQVASPQEQEARGSWLGDTRPDEDEPALLASHRAGPQPPPGAARLRLSSQHAAVPPAQSGQGIP